MNHELAGYNDAALSRYLSQFRLSAAERKAERTAYKAILSRIDETTDSFSKKVLQETLARILDDAVRSLASCVDHHFDEAILHHKRVRRAFQTPKTFDAIEAILSKATHTENFGQSRAYPLRTASTYTRRKRLKRGAVPLSKEAFPEELIESYYQFGVHTFRVGRAIVEIISMLEQRYGIDFRELEKKRGRVEKHR